MIKQIERKDAYFNMPESDFSHNLYFMGLLSSGTPYGVSHLQYDLEYSLGYLHFVADTWNKQVYKQMKDDFKELMTFIKNRNIKQLVVTHSLEDGELWAKFISRLSFPEPLIQALNGQKYLISVMEVSKWES